MNVQEAASVFSALAMLRRANQMRLYGQTEAIKCEQSARSILAELLTNYGINPDEHMTAAGKLIKPDELPF